MCPPPEEEDPVKLRHQTIRQYCEQHRPFDDLDLYYALLAQLDPEQNTGPDDPITPRVKRLLDSLG